MIYRKKMALFCIYVFLAHAVLGSSLFSYLPSELPYPTSLIPVVDGPVFAVAVDELGSNEDRVTFGSLSGVIARQSPQLFAVSQGIADLNGDSEAFWLSRLTSQGVNVDTTYLYDMNGLLERFAPDLDGFVAYATADDANAALTIASATAGRIIVSGSAPTAE